MRTLATGRRAAATWPPATDAPYAMALFLWPVGN
jgi:hypothetical protein